MTDGDQDSVPFTGDDNDVALVEVDVEAEAAEEERDRAFL
jgi:hypothetical protein